MASASSAEPDDGPAACAAEALRLLRDHAYFADRVDWAAATREVERAVGEGVDLGGALRPVFCALGDQHSFMRSGSGRHRRLASVVGLPVGRMLAHGIGYLRLPRFPAGHRAPAARDYVEAAWALLRQPPAIGWVLDLQGNTGGSIVPMITAIGPLLGPGRWLCYRRRDGRSLTYQYMAGELWADNHLLMVVPRPPEDAPRLPVAVLVDSRTASAAEGVLVAFKGRVRTRCFGQPTAGVPTGIVRHRLGDGSMLMIATSVAVDRCGRSYSTALKPNEPGGLAAAHAWVNAEETPTARCARERQLRGWGREIT